MEQAFLKILTPLFDALKRELLQLIRAEIKHSKAEEILHLEDAAKFLKLAEFTVKHKANKGLIKGHKPDKIWYFYKKDLIDYINKGANLTVEEERLNVSARIKKQIK